MHNEEYTYDHDKFSYTLKKKFDSGVTVELEFYLGETRIDGPLYVEIGLRSFTKRKQKDQTDFEFSIRGKDGLEPAIWATEKLLEFPEVIFSEPFWHTKDQVVYNIFWSDTRRRDVYHRWLSRHGFYFDSSSGVKCITKIYERRK